MGTRRELAEEVPETIVDNNGRIETIEGQRPGINKIQPARQQLIVFSMGRQSARDGPAGDHNYWMVIDGFAGEREVGEESLY